MGRRWFVASRVVVHVGALTPLALLVWDLISGGLGANPIQAVQLRTGKTAIILLLISLACTPVYLVSGFKPVLLLRRPLGLYAFTYVSLHFINFLGVDYGFNLALIRQDLFEKRYAVVGFAAYLILLALAVTSTRGWQDRLGRTWKRLHRLVYAAAVLGVAHFLWQVKADTRVPIVFGAVLVVLLALRPPWPGGAASGHQGPGT